MIVSWIVVSKFYSVREMIKFLRVFALLVLLASCLAHAADGNDWKAASQASKLEQMRAGDNQQLGEKRLSSYTFSQLFCKAA